MSPEQIQVAILITNTFLVPCALAIVRLLWQMERRIYRVELKLNLETE